MMMLIERPSILLLLGFLLVLSCSTLHSAQSSSTNFTDQSALTAFNSKISSGPYETGLAGNWSTATNFCNWIGVSCSRRRQRVTALNLSYMGLQGTISPHIGNLSFLVYLNLHNNSFFGSLPLEISRLHRLRILQLSFNQLKENHISGTLPMDLCHHCPNLQGLYISANEFSGKLPVQMNYCRELAFLSLFSNKFDRSIPEGFGSLEKLEYLSLGSNSLIGSIPPTISNLSRLSKLAIEKNNIKGSIPSDLWRLSNLEIFSIGHNYIRGEIPQKIFNMSSLQHINLVLNFLSGNLPSDTGFSCPNLESLNVGGNKLSGPIPSSLSNCSKLEIIGFASNTLSGSIPKSLGHLQYLQKLSLGDNHLTGEPENQEHNFLSSLSNCRSLELVSISNNPLDITLPDSVGNFSTTLRVIHAHESQIKGHIPMSMGSLKGLTWLDLGHNNLTGNIPSTIGGLKGLQRLYLEGNKIQGFIPADICQLKNLGELDLSNNKVYGSIPNCISNLNFLQRLYLSSNRLESPIPLN